MPLVRRDRVLLKNKSVFFKNFNQILQYRFKKRDLTVTIIFREGEMVAL